MEDFIQKLNTLLIANFPGAELELELAGPRRVGGLMVWDGFIGQEQIDRQKALWQVIRSSLSPEEQLRVSAVLTMTPEEMAAARHE